MTGYDWKGKGLRISVESHLYINNKEEDDKEKKEKEEKEEGMTFI